MLKLAPAEAAPVSLLLDMGVPELETVLLLEVEPVVEVPLALVVLLRRPADCEVPEVCEAFETAEVAELEPCDVADCVDATVLFAPAP